jgi:dienelactone hydrolase
MKGKFSASVSVVALTTTLMAAVTSVSIGQSPPPIGGGYTNVIAIPVNDPAIKAIGGAMFKPAGRGPFPAVVYMPGCGGIDSAMPRAVQKTLVDHVLDKGMAILIVDPFTPRNEPNGVCGDVDPLDGEKATQYFSRGGNDLLGR